MKKFVLVGGLLFAAVVAAADAIPYTFAPGTAIKSAEVNENFKSLHASAVAQESRIQGLEAAATAKPTDQLLCVVYSSFVVDGSAFPCVQATGPSAPRSLTMQQILTEGWVSVAAGGGDSSNRFVMIFRK